MIARYLYLIITLLLVFFIFNVENPNDLNKFNDINDLTNNITYINLYEEQINSSNIINNFINICLYGFTRTMNTIVPTIVQITNNTGKWIYYIIIGVCLVLLINIIRIIEFIIIIYTFIKEKKRLGNKIWE